MLTAILIIYSLAAIVTTIMAFCMLRTDCYNPDVGLRIFISLLTGAILPVVVIVLIIASLSPIIIPCATAIYLFG